jgi:hypothetical protein
MPRTRLLHLLTVLTMSAIGAAGAVAVALILDPPGGPAVAAARSALVEHWPTVLLGGGMGALTALAALAWQDRQAGRRRSVP